VSSERSWHVRRWAIVAAVGALLVGAIGCSSGQSSSTTLAAGLGATTTTARTAATSTSGGATTTSGGGSTATTAGGSTASTGQEQSFVQGDKTKEQYQAEISGLEATIKATPSDMASMQELAVAYYMVGRIEDAAKLYEQMLAKGENPTLRNNYGNMLRDLGKLDEAAAAYQQALKEDPTLTVAYVNLASVLSKQGKMDQALKLLDEGMTKVDAAGQTRLQNVKKAFQTPATTVTT
jgi:pentatricopeptide repeat protein